MVQVGVGVGHESPMPLLGEAWDAPHARASSAAKTPLKQSYHCVCAPCCVRLPQAVALSAETLYVPMYVLISALCCCR